MQLTCSDCAPSIAPGGHPGFSRAGEFIDASNWRTTPPDYGPLMNTDERGYFAAWNRAGARSCFQRGFISSNLQGPAPGRDCLRALGRCQCARQFPETPHLICEENHGWPKRSRTVLPLAPRHARVQPICLKVHQARVAITACGQPYDELCLVEKILAN